MNQHQVIYDMLSDDARSDETMQFKEFLKKNDVDLDFDISDDTVLDAIVNRANVLLNTSKVKDEDYYTVSIKDDVLGHVLLRGLASVNDKIESWFINNEAYYLKGKFLLLDSTEQLRLLKKIFGNGNIMTLKEYVDRNNLGERWSKTTLNIPYSERFKYYVMKWEIVHRLVGRRQCKLHDGLAFMKSGDKELGSVFMTVARFLLKQKIQQTLLPSEIRDALVEELEDEILDKIQDLSGSVIGYGDITEHMEKFPLCIQMLDRFLSSGKDLGHQELLQLGFFLKAVGFTIEDYRKYFFYRHPSNAGKSYEEFVSGHWGGYQLKHHFGLVGSGKSYSSFSCETIVKEGFCPYIELDGTKRRKLLESVYGEVYDQKTLDNLINKINKRMRVKTPYNCTIACGHEFYLHYSIEHVKGRVLHIRSPLSYYQLADHINAGKPIAEESIEITRKGKK